MKYRLLRLLWTAALIAGCVTPLRAAGSATGDAPAATAPVSWYAWGPGAFAEAQRRNAPMMLFINARWSRWSALMEREVFADPLIALSLNRVFIPIKVDRDRRPDVDRRHQEAVRALNGSTGWPLCVFLTPDGEVIYGGTFFSADDNFVTGQPGFREVLYRVSETWRTREAATRKDAGAFEARLRTTSQAAASTEPVPDDVLERVVGKMVSALDPIGGGFGNVPEAPKFPSPRVLELALLHYARYGRADSLQVVTRTLDAMLAGGIYDRLDGGFHRHATDRLWRLPRFEKKLDLNAEMALLLTHAWQMTRDERYREAAERTLAWATTFMCDPRGGFYTSQSADAYLGDDGGYFTWTAGELERALPGRDACELARHLYDVGELGDLPLTAPHRNVLFEALKLDEAAARAGVDARKKALVLREALDGLRAARRARTAPPIDRGLMVDANARMVSACLLGARAFDRPAFEAAALKALDRLLKEAVDDERGAAHVLGANGSPQYLYLSRDEAALAEACLDAFVATGKPAYRAAAQAALTRLHERFLDAERHVFRFRAHTAPNQLPPLGRLNDPHAPFQDAPSPSSNALAVTAMLRMAELARQPVWKERAARTLAYFGARLEVLGGLAPSLLLAEDAARHGLLQVVVSGGEEQVAQALARVAAGVYAPHVQVSRRRGEAGQPLKMYLQRGGEVRELEPDPVKIKSALEQAARP